MTNPPPDNTDIEIERENDRHEAEIMQRTLEGSLERERLVMARRGQGVFRRNVEQIETSCRVTGVRDLQHLRASHIKPWRDSSDFEKLDGNNGFLLSPHVDRLFDRGYISFENNGDLVVSDQLDREVLNKWNITGEFNAGVMRDEQIPYLEEHRAKILK